jgi:hypothetical protein
MNKNQGESYGTGDLNLAAAILTAGVPPEIPPVKLIATTGGEDYVRFMMKEVTIDGTISTRSMMEAWDSYHKFSKDNPDFFFTKIMSFIKSRPDGCRGYIDWCEYACSWLEMSMAACKRYMTGSPKIWESAPDSEPAYILAFISNRFWLLNMAKDFQKTGNFDVMTEHGKSIALISERLSKSKKEYLLSHLK